MMLRKPFWADFRLEDGQSITKISYSANGLRCFLAHATTFGKRSIFRKETKRRGQLVFLSVLIYEIFVDRTILIYCFGLYFCQMFKSKYDLLFLSDRFKECRRVLRQFPANRNMFRRQ